MNMVDLMWLFCGAFIGGLITLFFMAMVNASHEAEALEQAQRKIQALEEDKRALKIALESPTSPEKGGYTDKVNLLRQGEKAFKRPENKRIKRQCAVCGHRYSTCEEHCPACGQKASSADAVVLEGLSKEEFEVAKALRKRTCAICGHEYGKEQNQCPVCGCPAYVGLTKPEDLVDEIMEVCDDGSTAL